LWGLFPQILASGLVIAPNGLGDLPLAHSVGVQLGGLRLTGSHNQIIAKSRRMTAAAAVKPLARLEPIHKTAARE
jgi:hypothetical protein